VRDGCAVGVGAETPTLEAQIAGGCARYDEYNLVTVHCRTSYKYSLLISIRAFPSEGRITWVRRYRNIARVLMRTVLPIPPGTYMYAKVSTSRYVTSQTTRQARFPMQNVIPHIERAASLVC
jgi:hypothetical protein